MEALKHQKWSGEELKQFRDKERFIVVVSYSVVCSDPEILAYWWGVSFPDILVRRGLVRVFQVSIVIELHPVDVSINLRDVCDDGDSPNDDCRVSWKVADFYVEDVESVDWFDDGDFWERITDFNCCGITAVIPGFVRHGQDRSVIPPMSIRMRRVLVVTGVPISELPMVAGVGWDAAECFTGELQRFGHGAMVGAVCLGT